MDKQVNTTNNSAPASLHTDSTKIISWNFGGIGNSKASKTRVALDFIAETIKPLVIAGQEIVNENFKGNLKNIKLKGYEAVFDESMEESHGKSGILVTFFRRGEANYREIECEDKQSPMQAFMVSKKGCEEEFLVVNIYRKHRTNTDFNTLGELLQLNPHTLLCGDFNADPFTRNTTHGANKEAGRKLRNFISENDLYTPNENNEPTHHYAGRGLHTNTTIDHIIVSQSVKPLIKEFEISTDSVPGEKVDFHQALILTLEQNRNREDIKFQNFRKLNKQSYQELLNRNLDSDKYKKTKNLDSQEDVLDEVKKLTQCVMDTVDELIPAKARKNKQEFVPSEKLLNLITIKKRTFRSYLSSRTPLVKRLLKTAANKLATEVSDLIAEERRDHYNKLVSDIEGMPISTAKFWKETNRLAGLKTSGATGRGLTYEGEHAVSDGDKAKIHLKYQQTVFREHKIDKTCTREYYANVVRPNMEWLENEMKRPFDFPHITMQEVDKALKSTSPYKAPGLDRIKAICLRDATNKFKRRMLSVFNASLKIQFQPAEWKEAILVLIPKPGKKHSHPSGYRPISLLCVMAKLFDKIMCTRMRPYIEKARKLAKDTGEITQEPFLPKEQSGFRALMQCKDQFFRLMQHATQACQQNFNLLGVSFDGSKAFDTVAHEFLLSPMVDLVRSGQLPRYCLFYVKQFLEKRTFRVNVGGEVTVEKGNILAGVPQGSCSAPLLYIIFVADIPDPTTKYHEQIPQVPPHINKKDFYQWNRRGYKMECGKFADDLAAWIRIDKMRGLGKSKEISELVLQTYLHKVGNWADERKILFNADKTQLICFRGNRPANQWAPQTFEFQGENLSYSEEFKYLGILFDETLEFKSLFADLCKEMKSRICRLGFLTKRGDISPLTSYRWMQTLVFSVIAYFEIIWVKDEKKLLSLQKIINYARRTAMQAQKGVRNSLLAMRCPDFDFAKWGEKIAKKWYLKNVGSVENRKGRPKNPCILETIKNCNSWRNNRLAISKKGSAIHTPYDDLVRMTGVTGLEECINCQCERIEQAGLYYDR